MNFLTHILFASCILLSNSLSAGGGDATANVPAAFAEGETPRSELAVETSRDVLTQALRSHVDFPRFVQPMPASPFQAEPIQFQVDTDNRVNLVQVSGNDHRVVDYVKEHLQGKQLTEEPVLSGVTFATTLRFVQ